ncbi:DUF4917 family protein [Arthrobacter flavus]|uniref:DUF4917 family protein n=1 Tax=Arthrobacter flavus TaxID=95172 RepID=A0ABW4QBI2_9MICC
MTTLQSYDEALAWVNEEALAHGPHLLLGNGFSIAYDQDRFTYGALLAQADAEGLISSTAKQFFADNQTQDFEVGDCPRFG